MKFQKISLITALLVFTLIGNSWAADWFADFGKARQVAKKNEFYILVNFSGSDWCGWCMKLDNEVFSKKAFQDYAKDNLVLFVADFPRFKKIPAETAKQNNKLINEFGLEGFPTVFLLDPNGQVIAKTGYRPGGADAYVKHLKNIIQKSITKEK